MSEITLAAGGEAPEGIAVFIPAVYDIVWSLIPFALILIFFWKFVIPRFRKVIDDRAEVIEGGIAKAQAVQAEADAALEEYNQLLLAGRQEAARVRDHARVEGAQILAEFKESANTEAARIIAHANAQIEAERQAVLVSLRAEVGSLAIDLASGVVGESLSDDKRAAVVVDRFLAELENDAKAKA